MNKILISTLSAILIFSACSQDSDTPLNEDQEVIIQSETATVLDYSEEAFQAAAESGRTILFFHAKWCPTCIALDQELERDITKLPKDLTILRLDFDSELEMRQKYGVTVQHTLVEVDSSGDQINKWIGGGIALINQEISDEQDLSDEDISVESQDSEEGELPVIVKDVPLQDDFDGAKIEKSELLQGCFSKDCIPSIDEPKFESVSSANKWLDDEDTIFAVNYNGVLRAYPQGIMNWHEIVNDNIGGDPIAVTFCPLCGSAVAFERIVDDTITEFGVSGKLHNNDLVMYDRFEGNLWQQITGEAIVGPAAKRDEYLVQIPISTTTWGQWKNEHPETEVLSIDTGFSRDYDRYPYQTYESDDNLLFGIPGGPDESLQIKTVVYGIKINGESKAYQESSLKELGSIDDNVGGFEIQIRMDDAGEVQLVFKDDKEAPADINPPTRLFWFAWAAFNPDTTIY